MLESMARSTKSKICNSAFFCFFCLRIQHVSLREETQHSCIKCCMDYLVIIVDFLNNRILSCVEICDILAEHLAINKGEYERRCKSSKKKFLRELGR